ncbi:MAG: VOC family protein [OCS116 cluster bacterium]|nr:VOC family protein [OCS116 cluster bacterium]
MTVDMTTPGNSGWIEFSGPNAKQAQEFYSKVAGWNVVPVPAGDAQYPAIMLEDGPIGGFSPMPAATGSWLIYVTVSDVNAATQTAKDLGANIEIEPRDVPGVGRQSIIVDPQGARIALITYESMMA